MCSAQRNNCDVALTPQPRRSAKRRTRQREPAGPVTSSYDWSRDVALRLQHLPIGVAKLSRSAEASACQPISLRAPNGTKTTPRSIWIIPERLILIRPTRTSWKRLSLRMVLLVVTCLANGTGGRRGLHSIGRAPMMPSTGAYAQPEHRNR